MHMPSSGYMDVCREEEGEAAQRRAAAEAKAARQHEKRQRQKKQRSGKQASPPPRQLAASGAASPSHASTALENEMELRELPTDEGPAGLSNLVRSLALEPPAPAPAAVQSDGCSSQSWRQQGRVQQQAPMPGTSRWDQLQEDPASPPTPRAVPQALTPPPSSPAAGAAAAAAATTRQAGPATAATEGSDAHPEDDSCVVCMEGPKESVLVPCGHQAL